ncbi:MAG: tetratricopeptide repeat protein [Chloroflexi bacterium]|nr:tetratricopeptide repeat protein [Chloroflexota bacterium]
MGIPLKTGRKRRSYADYKPPKRKRPRDPFLILLIIALIAGGLWVSANRDTMRAEITSLVDEDSNPISQLIGTQQVQDTAGSPGGSTPTAAPDETDLVNQAQEALGTGDITRAVELYEQAADLNPNEPSYPYQMARLLLYQSALQYGDERDATLEAAFQAANRAIRSDPQSPHGYAIAGKVLDWQGQPEDGQNEVLRALEFDDSFAPAYSFLAEIQIDLQRYEEADASIQTALSLDPQNPDVLRDYAYVLESQTLYADAVDQYQQAIAVSPEIAFLRLALARNYRVLTDCQAALDELFAAEPFAQGSPVLQFEIGVTYESCVGDLATAVQSYEQALEIDEDFALAWERIGTISYYQNDYVRTTQALGRAYELGRDSLAINFQLGYALAQQQQCAEAQTYLTSAQELVTEEQEAIQDVINEAVELCSLPPSTLEPETEAP